MERRPQNAVHALLLAVDAVHDLERQHDARRARLLPESRAATLPVGLAVLVQQRLLEQIARGGEGEACVDTERVVEGEGERGGLLVDDLLVESGDSSTLGRPEASS